MSTLTQEELDELRVAFADVINYESNDPCDLIDPITYRAPDQDTCLHIAARRGQLRVVELLLKAGVAIDCIGDMGATPLHCASNPAVIQFLLANGASPDKLDQFGRPAFPSKNEPHAP